jgi:hypothetical protein
MITLTKILTIVFPLDSFSAFAVTKKPTLTPVAAKAKYDKAQRIDNRATVLALDLKVSKKKKPTPVTPAQDNSPISFTLSGKTKIAPDIFYGLFRPSK